METVEATTDAVACTLDVREVRQREETFRARLLDLIRRVQETDDGYVLELAPESIRAVREFVALESECCSFMTYTVDDRDGQLRLSLSGPEGTKQFVRDVWLTGRTVEAVAGNRGQGGRRQTQK